MAFQKVKTVYGFDANYWRILQINCNANRSDCVVDIALYKDKATRDADPNNVILTLKFELGSYFYSQQVTIDDSVKNILLKNVYTAIKAKILAQLELDPSEQNPELVWFADAQDA